MDLLYQSEIRPTNGEIRKTPASAQAIACAWWNTSVRLQSMPDALQLLRGADAFPGGGELDQDALAADLAVGIVLNDLLGAGDRGGVSNERSASTSVETRPGTSAASAAPTDTARRSATAATRASASPSCLAPQAMASFIVSANSGVPSAFSTIEGLVVQSTGFSRRTASMSPVSATTVVIVRS